MEQDPDSNAQSIPKKNHTEMEARREVTFVKKGGLKQKIQLIPNLASISLSTSAPLLTPKPLEPAFFNPTQKYRLLREMSP